MRFDQLAMALNFHTGTCKKENSLLVGDCISNQKAKNQQTDHPELSRPEDMTSKSDFRRRT